MLRTLSICTISTLLLTSFSTTVASNSQELTLLDEYLPDVTASTSLESDELLSGKLVTSQHSGLNQVPIVASLWPDQELLGNMQEGDSIELTPVAVTLAENDGSFSLTPDPEILRDLLGSGEHVVNFDIVILGEVTAGVPSASGSINLSGNGNIENSTGFEDLVAVEVAEPINVSTAIDSIESTEEYNACGYNLTKRHNGRQVVVGQTASNTKNVAAQFTYKSGGTSTIGVGLSTSAGWKADDTATVSNSSTTTYDKRTGAHSISYRKQQDYGTYTHTPCSGMLGGLPAMLRPIGNLYGSSAVISTAPNATRCATYANATVDVDSERAYKFSSGVSTSSITSINLSAQTGYNTNVSAKYSQTSGSQFKLCGTGNVQSSQIRAC